MIYGASPAEWDHFAHLLDLSADLLPVVSNPHATIDERSTLTSLGKTPSRYNSHRKVAGIAKWVQKSSTLEEIERWGTQPDYGICLQTRLVRAIDVDVPHEAQAAAIRDYIAHTLGLRLPERMRADSFKFLLGFTMRDKDTPYTKRKFHTEHGAIEFLAHGQQFVALGQHPAGSRYEWVGGLPPSFPVVTSEAFEALWDGLVRNFAVTGAESTASQSVKALKTTEAVDNDPVARHLLDSGLVKRIERDGRLHITCPWEDQHTTESSESSTTYWPAHTGGYQQGHFACLHAHCEHRTDGEFKEAIGYQDEDVLGDFEDLTVGQSRAPTPENAGDVAPTDQNKEGTDRYKLVHGSEFAILVEDEWIVKRILPKATMGVIFGESGSGKTFQVLDVAVHVALGLDWRGYPVRQGSVAYIAAEGAGGFRKRLKAIYEYLGVDPKEVPLYVLPASPNLLDKKDALAVARALVKVPNLSLIVVDTLAQTTAGGNENSGEDMGLALAHCKGLHVATGAMVLLVHHSGKDTSKGARGWSGLRAAADVELEVTRYEEDRVLSVTKQKDGSDVLDLEFSLETVTVGFDEECEPITSCVVVPHKSKNPAAPRTYKAGPSKGMGHNERIALRCFDDLIGMGDPGEGLAVGALVSAIELQLLPPDEGKRDRRREIAMRSLEHLQERGLLAVSGSGMLIKVGGSDE